MSFPNALHPTSFAPTGRADPTVPSLGGELQCGRCRRFFDDDPTPPGTQKEWWLCPACRVALFGDYS